MLKSRILTILVVAPLAVAAVLLLPNLYFSLAILCCVVISAYEWGRLLGFSGGWMASLLIGVTLLLWYFESQLHINRWLYILAAVWWALAFVVVVYYQRNSRSLISNRYLHALIAFLVLISAWFALSNMHGIYEKGPELTLYVLMIFWVADIGAYIVGKLIGRTKLASNVSPGKTVEGVLGGLAAVVLFGIGGASYFSVGSDLMTFVMLTLITALVSIIGDLYESILKRSAGVKDSGKLLPGHGGMLDRIDSVLAGTPIFLLGYSLLQ